MASPKQDRDPNGVNVHIQANFEDVFAESYDIQSVDCVWKTSQQCFSCSKNCCYNFLAVFCGLCAAFFWGFQFACVAFEHVWCLTPALKLFVINCSALQKFVGNLVGCILAPVCETCGLLFSSISVQHNGNNG
ncbi:caveolin-2-like [Ylistrum balloti]|uniref:caveolin-2-like n=1 Tax=Ylistrum balloti TaxID=509963 RepID=UPI002905BF45|nr:caveolin-2-like [Ylistrum balloti]